MDKPGMFLRKTVTLSIDLCILFTLILLEANGNVGKKPPEMWLYRHYQSGNSDSTLVEDKRDFEIKRETNITTAEVSCEAEYPIAWKFPHPENAKDAIRKGATTSNYRISNWANPDLMPENIKFKIIISIPLSSLRFLSLNITCAPVEQNATIVNSSVHIFWKGWDSFSLENAGRKLHIYSKPGNDPPLILPCRPAYPYLKILLEKKTEKEEWALFNMSSNHVTFDPKIGFISHKMAKKSYGWYKCSPAEPDVGVSLERWISSFLLMEVLQRTGNTEHQKIDFVPRSIIRGKATFTVKSPGRGVHKGKQVIYCCSGIKNKLPEMYLKRSITPLEAQVARDTILYDIAENRAHLNSRYMLKSCFYDALFPAVISVIVICRGKNIDFVDEFTNVFFPHVNGPVENRSSRILNERTDKSVGNTNSDTSTNQFLDSANLNTATVSQKIMVTILRKSREEDEILKTNSEYFCDKPVIHNVSAINKFSGNTIEKGDVHLFEYDRDLYYEGEDLVFMCLGGKLLYANGAYLRLNWKNGTKTIVAPTSKDYQTLPCGNNVGLGGFVHLSQNISIAFRDSTAESKFGSVTANPEISSVECLMPQVKSGDWDTISKNLIILPRVTVTFREPENESVTLSEEEIGKVLTCTTNHGCPSPIFTCTKDGQQFLIRNAADTKRTKTQPAISMTEHFDNENGVTVTTIVISFPKVKINDKGIYQCTAASGGTTIMRSINVSVTGKDVMTEKSEALHFD